MANQVTVSNNNTINVTVEPPANVQVQVSRAVIGTVANVSNANLANYVTQPNQSNITSVGTLTGLTSSGNITAPFFIGNVVGNISGNIVVPGTNTAVLFNQQGNAGASDALTFNYSSNVLTANGNIVANYYIGNGSQLTDIIAVNANYANYANIANTANSVAVANVVGIGNIAVINLDGNVSNILHGNGYWGPESGSLNANYANFAGDVVNASQPNITSLGTLTGLVVGGDITPNSNVTHNLGNNTNRFNDLYLAGNTIYLGAQELSANATGISFTGILTGNANGLSNITGGNITGYVANATHSNVADLANSVAGANVTGQVNYAATANSVAGANVSGAVAFATTANAVAGANVSGQVSYAAVANSVAGANVTGAVSLATYATTANSVAGANVSGQVGYAAVANSVAVGNVVGIGNIATTNYNGNGSTVLAGNGAWVAQGGGGSGTSISNGNSNVDIPVANGNINFTSVGNTNMVITGTGVNVAGYLTVAGNAIIGNITDVDSVTFDTANVPATVSVAQLSWNDGDGTLDLGLKGGNVTLQVGEQQYARVYNDTASALTKGQVVYVVGAAGNRLAIGLAQANTETTSVGTIGFVAESIAVGSEGFVITSGALYKLNTLGYTPGATVYLSPSTPGGWTTTKPTAPDQLVVLGWIERVSATVGSIYIKVDNGYELDELHNVLITSPVAGQALVYNASNLWVNGNPNIANIANTVSDNAQPNITSTGNLVYLNVRDDSNANSVIQQFIPNTIPVWTNSTTNASYRVTTQYWPNASTNYPVEAFVRSRGNATTPTTAVASDRVSGGRFLAYNGNANVMMGGETWTLTGTVNANSNAAFTGGQWNLFTGNPSGNVANANASSAQNGLAFTNSGSLQITPGTAPNVSLGQAATGILLQSWGESTTNLAGAGGINSQKARGNRDGALSVEPGDDLGRWNAWGYNGTNYQSGNAAALVATVASDYVANASIIPIDIRIRAVSNTASAANTWFYGNGLVSFPDGINAAGTANVSGLNVTGISNLGSNSNVVITGGSSGYVLSTNGSGNLSWVAQSGGGGSAEVDFTPSFLLGGM